MIISKLEPGGGNVYKPHPMMIHSGRFWRCAHGNTGFDGNLEFIGCPECEQNDPEAAKKFLTPTKDTP